MSELWIAIGNPLRGDDNLAHEAVREAPEGATVRHVLQLTPELAADIAGYGKVVFVDADVGVSTPVLQPLDSGPPSGGGPLTHHSSPHYVVALARRLYGWSGEAWVYRLPASDFS